MEGRRKFTREGEEKRRDQLIAAALDMIAEGGPAQATVRAIASKAGVTQGLIRHYFTTKEDLTRAAYETFMTGLTEDTYANVGEMPADPLEKLTAFVAASLRPPVMSATKIGLWSGFINMVRHDQHMAVIHEKTYLAFRAKLEEMIADTGVTSDAAALRRLAIACNGVIDGLWLEGAAYPQGFGEDELAIIGVDSVGAILGLDLSKHFRPPTEQDKTL